jgi:hypothetical protein
MSVLEQQQQAFLKSLFLPASELDIKNIAVCADSMGVRGLKVYKANGHALAERALVAAYPVLAQMLGNESFSSLARALWHATPPHCGDMAQWGDTLAEFVAASVQLHTCAGAADAALQPATLALLGSHNLDALTVQLAPGTDLICSPWPIASLVRAHRDDGVTMTQAATLLRNGHAEEVVVWRQGYRPRLRNAKPGEAGFVSALLQGKPLGAALDAALQLEINNWLSEAIETGLLMAVHPI